MEIPYKIQNLENEPLTTTNSSNEYTEQEEIPFHYVDDYLYHGIRFQMYLEKLESIFKSRKILAGKYIEGYHQYSDNCNKGEYVSLLKRKTTNDVTYETFIEENISLLVTPLCDAIETKYVDYNTWIQIQEKNIYHQLKNIYSYMLGECLCKDFIPIEMVKAIGIPYQRLRLQGKIEYVNQLIEDIQKLMKQYEIALPIVDTSRFNYILVGDNKITKRRKLSGKSQ